MHTSSAPKGNASSMPTGWWPTAATTRGGTARRVTMNLKQLSDDFKRRYHMILDSTIDASLIEGFTELSAMLGATLR